MWEKIEDYWKISLQVILCLFVFRSTSYCEITQSMCKIETLFQSSPSLVDIVKPFVATVATTITQEQYTGSYTLIRSDARPFLKCIT